MVGLGLVPAALSPQAPPILCARVTGCHRHGVTVQGTPHGGQVGRTQAGSAVNSVVLNTWPSWTFIFLIRKLSVAWKRVVETELNDLRILWLEAYFFTLGDLSSFYNSDRKSVV